MPTDNHANSTPGLDSPGENHFAITPNDGADVDHTTRAMYVGTGGDVKFTAKGGTTETWPNVPSGSIIPMRATRVFATGTSASGIIGIY